jgi:hypothetical protein
MAHRAHLSVVAGTDVPTARADQVHDLAEAVVTRAADFAAIADIVMRASGTDRVRATIAGTRIAAFLLTGK